MAKRIWNHLFSLAAASQNHSLSKPCPPPYLFFTSSFPTRLCFTRENEINAPTLIPSRITKVSLYSNCPSPQSTTPAEAEAEEEPLFPGVDFLHWVVVMDSASVGVGATQEQAIDVYVQTLAKVLRSEDEAKKRIYSIWFTKYFWFGCKVDQSTANSIGALPGVKLVFPDSFIDPEKMDYGGVPFIDGRILPEELAQESKESDQS